MVYLWVFLILWGKGRKNMAEASSEVPSESSSERFPGLTKALGSIPELLSSVSDGFLDASMIDLDTKKKVVQYGGSKGAQLLLDAFYLKLEQSRDYENLGLAIFRKEKDLKEVVDTAKPPMKKPQHPQLQIVSKATHSPSPKLSPRSSPRRISPRMSDRSEHISSRTLHESFNSLLVDFTKLTSKSDIYLDSVKMKLGISLRYSHHSIPELNETVTGFEQCPSIDRAMKYLMERNLLGFLNFQILKLFQIKEFDKCIQDYEAFYQLFMGNKFETIAKAVQEMPGNGNQLENGLPEMTIDLNHPWETKSYSQWQEVLQAIVDWTEFLLIKNIECSSNAVSITYAILPFMLMRIVKDIDDTNTFKRLNGIGASFVIHPDIMNRGKTEAELIKREIESQLADIKLKLVDTSPDTTSSTASTSKATMQTDVATISTGYKLLTPIHDNHKCQLCFGLLNQPRQLSCCGYMICYSHISNIAKKCPNCRETNFRLVKSNRTEKKIKALPVECTAKDCYWSGPLEGFDKHTCPETKEKRQKQQRQKEKEEMEEHSKKTDQKIIEVNQKKKMSRQMSNKSFSLEEKSAPNAVSIDNLPGGKVIYTVSGPDAKEIDWCDKNVISLVIPAHIAPPQSAIKISIEPIPIEKCTFPSDGVLVSNLFEVTTSCDIKQPITIKLRHCVAVNEEDDMKCLTFIKAESPERPGLPFRFKKHEGGVFNSGSFYGFLECRTFSGITIQQLKRMFIRPPPLQCAVKILSCRDEQEYEACIIVTKNIDGLIEQAIEKFKKQTNNTDIKVPVTDALELVKHRIKVKSDKESSDHAWTIEPKRGSVCKIYRDTIENFDGSQDVPPWLMYYVMMKENCTSSRLLHDFKFKGAKDPNLSFRFKVDLPRKQDSFSERVKEASRSPTPSNNVQHDGDDDSDDDGNDDDNDDDNTKTVLDKEPNYRLVLEVIGVDRWLEIGASLGLRPYYLRAIDQERSDKTLAMVKMFEAWERADGKDGVADFKWSALMKQLRYTSIEKKHLKKIKLKLVDKLSKDDEK